MKNMPCPNPKFQFVQKSLDITWHLQLEKFSALGSLGDPAEKSRESHLETLDGADEQRWTQRSNR